MVIFSDFFQFTEGIQKRRFLFLLVKPFWPKACGALRMLAAGAKARFTRHTGGCGDYSPVCRNVQWKKTMKKDSRIPVSPNLGTSLNRDPKVDVPIVCMLRLGGCMAGASDGSLQTLVRVVAQMMLTLRCRRLNSHMKSIIFVGYLEVTIGSVIFCRFQRQAHVE